MKPWLKPIVFFASVALCAPTAEASGPSALTATVQSAASVALHQPAASIVLQWVDLNAQEIGFLVERSVNPRLRNGWTVIASVGADSTSYQDAAVSPATTYYYRVRALRNALRRGVLVTLFSSYSKRVKATTPASPQGPYPLRGASGSYDNPSALDGIVGTGFNLVETHPDRSELDALPPGVKAIVWIGQYDNRTCAFTNSDDLVRSQVAAIAGHPAVAVYQLADEPEVWNCPNAPAQLKARSDLVKSADPGRDTMVAVMPHEGTGNPYAPYVGAFDIIATDPYPCRANLPADWGQITGAIAQLEEARVPRYWAYIQAFQENSYRLPTAAELSEEFRLWRTTRMEAYIVFAWAWAGVSLENHPDLVDVLALENSR